MTKRKMSNNIFEDKLDYYEISSWMCKYEKHKNIKILEIISEGYSLQDDVVKNYYSVKNLMDYLYDCHYYNGIPLYIDEDFEIGIYKYKNNIFKINIMSKDTSIKWRINII